MAHLAVARYREGPFAIMTSATGFSLGNLFHIMLLMQLDTSVQLVVTFGTIQLLHLAGLVSENCFLPDNHIAMLSIRLDRSTASKSSDSDDHGQETETVH
jgi:hypothetical protein